MENMPNMLKDQHVEEKVIKPASGVAVLCLVLLGLCGSVGLIILGAIQVDAGISLGNLWIVSGILLSLISIICMIGIRVVRPEEALVLTLFGHYYGTIKEAGMHFVNPFCTAFNPAAHTVLGQSGDVGGQGSQGSINVNLQTATGGASKKISLKIMTLSNSRQKINDALGNPVDISVAVLWRVADTAKAVFHVDNFKEYLSLQCDAAVRDIVRIYPYDVSDHIDTTGDGEPDDGSLRGSSRTVAERIRLQIKEKVQDAGLDIVDARITYLAYAPEIAQAMLQRQQAQAIIDARRMIVDGAVGMVEMALDKLREQNVVELDEERKAQMVSNLLVVLCSNRDTQPIVNSGSLY